jgi:CubicO group peptidase (beta-lactamase class C family)
LLTDAIGCQDDPTFLAFGEDDRPGRLAISPRDFARFGLLYLRGGRWGDRQLLSEKLAKMAVTSPVPNSIPRAGNKPTEMIPGQRTAGSRVIPDNQTDHMGSYSWLWWINGLDRESKRHWPDVPADAFGCFGHGGKRAMVVLPSQDLIVSWNNARIEGRDQENESLRMILDAVAKPETTAVSAGSPFFLCGPGDPGVFVSQASVQVASGDRLWHRPAGFGAEVAVCIGREGSSAGRAR